MVEGKELFSRTREFIATTKSEDVNTTPHAPRLPNQSVVNHQYKRNCYPGM